MARPGCRGNDRKTETTNGHAQKSYELIHWHAVMHAIASSNSAVSGVPHRGVWEVSPDSR